MARPRSGHLSLAFGPRLVRLPNNADSDRSDGTESADADHHRGRFDRCRGRPARTTNGKQALARGFIALASALVVVVLVVQIAHAAGWLATGFANWRPLALAVLLWFVAIDVGIVVLRGVARDSGRSFLLPAVQLTIAFVIFPTIFGLYISFTDWNLSATAGRQFNGLDNFRQMFGDADFWRVLGNNFKYHDRRAGPVCHRLRPRSVAQPTDPRPRSSSASSSCCPSCLARSPSAG